MLYVVVRVEKFIYFLIVVELRSKLEFLHTVVEVVAPFNNTQ